MNYHFQPHKIKSLTSIFIVALEVTCFAQDHIDHPIGPPPKIEAFQGVIELQKIYHIPADPENGFYWSYYLGSPKTVNKNMSLYVEPNNDGKTGAPFETHKYWASIKCEQALFDYAYELETFVIVPVFPRPTLDNGNNLYTHALTRAVVEETSNELKRIDLQLLAMVDDAKKKIRDSKYQVPEKFMLWGFSAAGDFVTRMSLIHPEHIKCVVAGGLGGLPILPMKELEGTALDYPVGIADFNDLFGRDFNASSFKSIPMKFFQGGDDENDSVAEGKQLEEKSSFLSDSYSYDQCIFVNGYFGEKPVDRVPLVLDIYRNFGVSNFSYVIVPETDHRTDPFEDEVLAFLKKYGVEE